MIETSIAFFIGCFLGALCMAIFAALKFFALEERVTELEADRDKYKSLLDSIYD